MPKPRKGHKKKPTGSRGKKPQDTSTPLRLYGGLGKGSSTDSKTNGHPKKDASTRRPPKSEADKAELAVAQAKGGGNQSQLLTSENPRELLNDLMQIQGAVAKGWNIRQKDMIRDRLLRIMEKTEAEVVTKEGLVDSETKADELAIQAAKVLTLMDTADVKRIEVIDKIVNKPATPFSPGTNPNGESPTSLTATEEGRSALAQLALRFGARELVIDDRAIISEHSAQADNDLPRDEPESKGWTSDDP